MKVRPNIMFHFYCSVGVEPTSHINFHFHAGKSKLTVSTSRLPNGSGRFWHAAQELVAAELGRQ